MLLARCHNNTPCENEKQTTLRAELIADYIILETNSILVVHFQHFLKLAMIVNYKFRRVCVCVCVFYNLLFDNNLDTNKFFKQ